MSERRATSDTEPAAVLRSSAPTSLWGSFRSSLRVVFVGGVISFRALFNCLNPYIFVPTMLIAPVFQLLAVVSVDEENRFFQQVSLSQLIDQKTEALIRVAKRFEKWMLLRPARRAPRVVVGDREEREERGFALFFQPRGGKGHQVFVVDAPARAFSARNGFFDVPLPENRLEAELLEEFMGISEGKVPSLDEGGMVAVLR